MFINYFDLSPLRENETTQNRQENKLNIFGGGGGTEVGGAGSGRVSAGSGRVSAGDLSDVIPVIIFVVVKLETKDFDVIVAIVGRHFSTSASTTATTTTTTRMSKAFPGMSVHGAALRIRSVAMWALDCWTEMGEGGGGGG